MNAQTLEVYLYDKLVGTLAHQSSGCWDWQPTVPPPAQPDAAWSLNNLTSTSIRPEQTSTWFRALLPDPAVNARLALKAGVSAGHDFALLAMLGGDSPGALSLRRPGPAAMAATSPAVLTSETLGLLLEALREGQPGAALGHALWPGDGAVLPLLETGGGFALSVPGAPSNVLVRVGRHGLPGAAANEGFCMLLAGTLGLPVVPSRWMPEHGGFLVLGRPDWVAEAAGEPHRRQIETFGQLAGLPPEQAFEREGGLALLDCATLIRRYSIAPALDLRSFLRWIACCVLCGNGLATGNGLRFVFTPTGPRLAPFSELVATHVYPAMSERLGFYIGREDRPDWVVPARWRELAEETGVGSRYLLGLLRELALATGPALVATRQAWQAAYGWSPALESVAALIEQRSRQLWVALEAEQSHQP